MKYMVFAAVVGGVSLSTTTASAVPVSFGDTGGLAGTYRPGGVPMIHAAWDKTRVTACSDLMPGDDLTLTGHDWTPAPRLARRGFRLFHGDLSTDRSGLAALFARIDVTRDPSSCAADSGAGFDPTDCGPRPLPMSGEAFGSILSGPFTPTVLKGTWPAIGTAQSTILSGPLLGGGLLLGAIGGVAILARARLLRPRRRGRRRRKTARHHTAA